MNTYRPSQSCPGTRSRRDCLRLGASLLGGLTLPQLLQAERQVAAPHHRSGKSMIVLWLWGGPSHMETFDLKPEAPLEYRGEFRPIRTPVAGLMISEHLPRLASMATRWSVIRSLHHNSDGHVNSTHTMLTGYPGAPIEMPPFRPQYPDVWSVASHWCGPSNAGVPALVALPRLRYEGAAHLGSGLAPLQIEADPSQPKFHVPGFALQDLSSDRLTDRQHLLREFERLRRGFLNNSTMDALDDYSAQAVDLLTTNRMQQAFDLSQEPAATRDRYGHHAVGQRCLLARRLVEAGVRLVSIDFPCVPGQKAFSWDDHASVWNIFDEMKIRLPVLDQVVSATIADIYERGLSDDVLFIVMGEMSHTPRLSNYQGQPGREHWGQTMSVLLSGGGLRMGQAVGATSAKGDEPIHRPLTPNDLLATIYRHLGIPLATQFPDRSGRPTPILPHGQPIDELI